MNLTGRKHPYFEKSINFHDFLHTMRFVSISRTVENWWENPCISHMTTLVNFFLWTLRFEWSVKKPCVAKVLLAIWEIFLHENNRDYNSYKFAFVLFLFFLTNQRQKSGSQQIDGLVTKKYLFFVFCLTESRSYFKTMSNLIDFYKGIFLQVIPVCIIIPWFRQGR